MISPIEQGERSVLGMALRSVEKLQTRIDELENPDPIAIVGFALVLPDGIDDDARLWQTLMQADSVIAPRAEWTTGETLPDSGLQFGTVDHPGRFDHDFFRVAGAEVPLMDIQQRMLLDTSWRAFEHAGYPADTLRDTRTGVFFGLCGSDFEQTLGEVDAAAAPFAATGLAGSVAAGRVSHSFGFSGPAMVVDTACSSSLIATTLACGALRNAECDLAIAGGSNILCAPRSTKALDALGVLSRTGRCSPFSAEADGFVRGEGCAIVVLKRLCDARRDGDRIWSVIRGWAVNHDGTAASLTAPSRHAQEALIRAALDHAGAGPDDIGFVEAHGTGTLLGDPIELGGLSTIFGDRSTPLLVTSSKGNFGHLEAAAGVLGLIKAALSLDHGVLPPSAHAYPLNGHFAWDRASIHVPVDPVPLRDDALAGVSAFGFSGTNVHVILEPPPPVEQVAEEEVADLLLLSAPSEGELDRLVAQAASADSASSRFRPGCSGSRTRRTPLRHRVAAIGASWKELGDDLRARMTHLSDRGDEPDRPVVRVFSGQGMQFPGMGQGLMRRFRQVGDVVAEAADHLSPLGIDLMAGLRESKSDRHLMRGAWLQPALVALQTGIDRFLTQAIGDPDLVIGHSLGEISAAVSSGALEFADAIRLAYHRGTACDLVSRTGSLCAITLGHDDVHDLVGTVGGELWVSVVNGPRQTVVGGTGEALAALEQAAAHRSLKCVKLGGHWPFHTPLMADAADYLRTAIFVVQARDVPCGIVSSVTGQAISGGALTLDYWCDQLVSPVLFDQALGTALDGRDADIVEIGVHPVLSAADSRPGVRWQATARRGEPDGRGLLRLFGDWFEGRRPVDWRAIGDAAPFEPVPLPRISRRADLVQAAHERSRPVLNSLEAISDVMGIDLRGVAPDTPLDHLGVASLSLIAAKELLPLALRDRISIATTVAELRVLIGEASHGARTDVAEASIALTRIRSLAPPAGNEPPVHLPVELHAESAWDETCWTQDVRRRWRRHAQRFADVARQKERQGWSAFALLHLVTGPLGELREMTHCRALGLMAGADAAWQGLASDRDALVMHLLRERGGTILVTSDDHDGAIDLITVEPEHA